MQLNREAELRIGSLDVRPSSLEVVWPDGRETLQRRVMTVLVLLARSRNEVVTRQELIDRCWGGYAVSDDAVNRVIGQLRKMARRARDPFHIDTIPRVGFRLVVETPAAAALDESAPPPARELLPRFTDDNLRLVGAAFVAAVVSIAAVVAWTLHPRAQATASPPEVVVESFAVSGPGLPATFAADLREDMLTTFQPGAAAATLRSGAPGQDPGAYRLRGRVESAGEKVEVYARLEPPDGSRILWSSHYEVPLGQARPAAIGHEVIHGVNCLMSAADGPHAPGLASPAMATWADFCVANRDGAAQLDRELAALRRTVALAPKFFFAHAELGQFLSVAAERAEPSARQALTDEGLASAMRAQRLEPGRGEGYMAEAFLRQGADPARAEALFLKALSLRPSRLLWEAQAYSHFLERTGRIEDAAEQHRRVLAVQPNNLFEINMMAWDDAIRGRYDSARQTLERQWMDRQCSLWLRLDIAIWTKNWSEAQAIAREPSGCAVMPGRVALVDALSSGDPARISRTGAQLETLAADPANLSRFTVAALALTGRDRAAVAAAGRLFDQEGPRQLFMVYEPEFAAARRTPEFEALAARLGLVGYWRTSGHAPDFCRAPDPPDLCRRLQAQAPKAVR